MMIIFAEKKRIGGDHKAAKQSTTWSQHVLK